VSAYLIAALRVTDPEQFAVYAAGVPAEVEAHGGRYLARGGRSIVFEGPDVDRVVVIEFDDLAAAEAYYRSPGYTVLRLIRENAAEGVLLITETLT
jgi:uncharacterized protein (DUF1330 family)